MNNWTDPEYTERIVVRDGKVEAEFYVEIVFAQENVQHGRPVETQPAIRVTTHHTYDDAEKIVIRKREYTVDTVDVFDHGTWRLSREHYSRGALDDNGLPVGWRTATGKQLDALADKARDEFVAHNPDWQRKSRALRVLGKIRREEQEITKHRDEIAAHEKSLSEWRRELESINQGKKSSK